MEDNTFNVDTETNDLNGAKGDHKQDFSELEALMTRIKELLANVLKREICLEDELATKNEEIASITASLEKSNIEIAELQNQIAKMRATNENNQSLIGGLSSLVAEQEMQVQNLREVIGTKEQIIMSFSVSLENSKEEIVGLYKQVDELKATNENQKTLIGEYEEKLDLLIGEISLLTNQQSESQIEENSVLKTEPSDTEVKSVLKSEPNTTEENSLLKEEQEAKEESSVLKADTNAKKENKMLKTDRKAQKKKLKKFLKENPNANEKILAELLGVDSSYIFDLRKEFDI